MTHEEALEKTKDLLRTLVPKSMEYNIAIYDASYHGDMEWFRNQLDQLIDMCNELKQSL